MRYLVVLKQVFNWYAKAGVRVLGAMPEAEAQVAVPHLLERDGDGLDRVAKQARSARRLSLPYSLDCPSSKFHDFEDVSL